MSLVMFIAPLAILMLTSTFFNLAVSVTVNCNMWLGNAIIGNKPHFIISRTINPLIIGPQFLVHHYSHIILLINLSSNDLILRRFLYNAIFFNDLLDTFLKFYKILATFTVQNPRY